MNLSPTWQTAHKRYSVIALAAGTFLQVVWSVAPAGMPLWAILAVNGVIGGLGLIGSYLAQSEVTGNATTSQ